VPKNGFIKPFLGTSFTTVSVLEIYTYLWYNYISLEIILIKRKSEPMRFILVIATLCGLTTQAAAWNPSCQQLAGNIQQLQALDSQLGPEGQAGIQQQIAYYNANCTGQQRAAPVQRSAPTQAQPRRSVGEALLEGLEADIAKEQRRQASVPTPRASAPAVVAPTKPYDETAALRKLEKLAPVQPAPTAAQPTRTAPSVATKPLLVKGTCGPGTTAQRTGSIGNSPGFQSETICMPIIDAPGVVIPTIASQGRTNPGTCDPRFNPAQYLKFDAAMGREVMIYNPHGC
jgi:hypothetical protein